uniref:Uncharacterized protein n=1 Tax=Rhizophora mucronata TaxID=61149 RepID=A0A2P2PW90_RHIMU
MVMVTIHQILWINIVNSRNASRGQQLQRCCNY